MGLLERLKLNKTKENGNAYQPKEKTVKKNRCCMVVFASM